MVRNPYAAHPLLKACLVALSLTLLSPGARAEARNYVIDPDHFSIGFKVRHIGYASILGLFLKARGSFVYDEARGRLESGQVVVAADSAFSNHAARDRHIHESDFLNAREYPDITFQATRYTPTGSSSGKLDGMLTLLGTTRPVTLEVTLNKAASYPFAHRQHTLGVSAGTTIRRSEWGMRYGVDGGLVGDEVRLDFEFEAIRQQP